MDWLAFDIGGANLKAADGLGFALSRPFPLWKQPRDLPAALARILADSPPAKALAVTMTGELADCFSTKAEGVWAILDAVTVAAGRRAVHVYRIDGSWASPAAAASEPLLAAASNWLALTQFAGRYAAHGVGLVVDVGSTTCDIVPLDEGNPSPWGRTDLERLASGELVYTGVQRSPLCALASHVPWRRRQMPTAQEVFATSLDVYLVLEDLPEEPENTHTADGRAATIEAAHDRLARSICGDRTLIERSETLAIARFVAEAQLRTVVHAAKRVVGRMSALPRTVVISGQGEFFALRVVRRLGFASEVISLGKELGPNVSQAATAHALAVIARKNEP
ncbi:MAG: H4MPT-linked C1 transfer pathway protein [Rhodopirellula sp.]|nr:H4MPT-linked C1 transfer pathway protein [Rhodopirellula sp.]